MKKPKVTRKDPDAVKRIIKNVARVKGAKVEVGIIDDGTMHKDADMTVYELAMIHEFGSVEARIPARPVIQPTMKKNRFEYRRMMFVSAKKLTLGRENVEDSLKAIGERAADDMRARILAGIFKPLAASTIEAKGHADPLIDSGQLYDAFDYKVTVK